MDTTFNTVDCKQFIHSTYHRGCVGTGGIVSTNDLLALPTPISVKSWKEYWSKFFLQDSKLWWLSSSQNCANCPQDCDDCHVRQVLKIVMTVISNCDNCHSAIMHSLIIIILHKSQLDPILLTLGQYLHHYLLVRWSSPRLHDTRQHTRTQKTMINIIGIIISCLHR